MFAVFVPVLYLPTQLTRIKTEASFVAKDPWNGNHPCTFTLDSYAVTLRGAKLVPKMARESRWVGGFHHALRSEADGVARFLPESLIELWLRRQVSLEALPALLKQMDPSLRKSDYKPILHSLSMKIFGVFESICCAGLVVIAVVAVVLGQSPLWLAAAIVAGTASICWLFLYQVYWRMLFRRKRQIQWLLGYISSVTPDAPGHLDGLKKRDPPAKKDNFQAAALPTTPKPSSLYDPFSALGENLQRSAVQLPPRPPLISPQPMPLQTVVLSTTLEGKEIQLSRAAAKEPLPTSLEPAGLKAPKDFIFESIMTVPEVMEPAIEPRLRKAFPDLEWKELAENSGKVRIEGTRREMPQRVILSIVRNESSGTFKLWNTVSAQDQSEAVKSLKAMLERLKSALLGWSQFHLPQFKTRPPAGIDIDREDIVDLVFPLERGQIRLFQSNSVIIISRILLEALAVHGEILDSRAKNPETYPDSDNPEGRAARMRGAAARLILGQGAPTGSGNDLDVEIALVHEAHSLVGELLENGLAQVIPYGPGGGRAAGAPSISPRRIKVHYFGSGGLGYISYSGVDGEAGNLGEFLRLDWCSSRSATSGERAQSLGL